MNDRAAATSTPQAPLSSDSAGESAPHSPHHTEGSIKDTIESIIVAFILAFIFRGFVVEAFVIPTGSMATTLLGAHMRFGCQDCGYEFDVNYPGEGDGDELRIPSHAVWEDRTGRVFNRIFAAYCPNCGFKVPRQDPHDPRNDATGPPVRYGDRILVLKYLYLVSQPQRWDVVVFKAPADPGKYDYTQNYIKRLVGKPGESIFILDGDVYVGKPDATPEEFVVQTKPRKVQEALWRIVADNDFLPRGLGHWVQPWKTQADETGWDISGREFHFNNPTGAATLTFDPSANPDKHALTDWLAYDQLKVLEAPDLYHQQSYAPANHVSDVKLSFYYQRTAGDGALHLTLSKLGYEFTATIDGDSASLAMLDPSTGQTTTIGEAIPLSPAGSRPRHIEFTNVDYRVTLRVDGRDLIQTTPQQFHPDIPRLLEAAESDRDLPKPRIALTAQNQTCTLSHISLWRDVYYINRDKNIRWATPYTFPKQVMTLGDDEYFVLGDNSPISGDARTWTEPINLPEERLQVKPGVVPGRFLIGKAFFVYWPAGYRPLDSAPALIPNFGDMRFIH